MCNVSKYRQTGLGGVNTRGVGNNIINCDVISRVEGCN